MDHDFEYQPQGVHQQMAFAPRQLLGPIVAMRAAPFGRFDRLAIHDGGAGRRLSPGLPSHPFAQRSVDALPSAVLVPFAEIGIDGGTPMLLGGHHSQLLQHAQHVPIHPPLGHLVTYHATDRDASHLDLLTSGWNALERPPLGALSRPTCHDLISFDHLIFNSEAQIGKSRAVQDDKLPQAFLTLDSGASRG